MMRVSSLLPPADLLDKVQGIEAGLRQRRRLGRLGWGGLMLASTAELLVELKASGIGSFVQELSKTGLATLPHYWPYLLPMAFVVFFLLLGCWSTFWLAESRRPFRYTCSIAPFERGGLPPAAPAPVDAAMAW